MLGSHNTMTYLPPKKWWMKFINWTAKCQEVDILEQYKLGVRWFDLRVRFVDDGSNKVRNWEPEFGHGLISYKGDVFDTIKALNDIGESPVYVRVLLETSKPDDLQETCFRRFCTIIEDSYKNLQFIGGEAKYDWKKKYLFKQIYEVPTFAESYSSMNADWTKLNDIFPKRWAKKHNALAREQYTNIILDYVNI